MVGSEGTLGVITELTLKLHPLPESVAAAVCSFPDAACAVGAAMALIQLGVPIARCEFMDTHAVRAVNARDGFGLRESPLLLMEFHGSPASTAEQAATSQRVAADFSGAGFDWATTPEARSRLWAARHHAYLSGLQMRPGCRAVTTDTCVPISHLAENVVAALADAEAAGLPHFIVGHVGDGNFHIAYLIDPHLPAERELAEQLNSALVRRALRSGGTCTGEHGIGLHKQGFLIEETGEGAVAMMRAIKQALDPLNILNPGKIFAI
jgi:D-lactate dehydrogenase (cytochrome)